MKLNFPTVTTNKIILFLSILLISSCGNYELKSDAQFVENSNLQAGNNSEVVVNKTDDQNTKTAQINDGLEQAANRLNELYDGKKCKEFFAAFPNTFDDFDRLYGYDDETGERRLYSKSEHIPYFFNCPAVSDRERLEKVIGIGIGGKWDADSIGWFSDLTYDLVKIHSKETKEILDDLPNEKAASFWYFLFDSPHPNDKQNVRNFELMQFVLGKDSKQSKLLAEQFQKLKDSDDGHGR